MLNEVDQRTLQQLLEKNFPGFPLKFISALHHKGLESWLKSLHSDTKVGTRIAEVDYDIYAKGEALMGWYNANFIVHHANSSLIPWEEFNLKFYDAVTTGFSA